jgi:hypothetical protein
LAKFVHICLAFAFAVNCFEFDLLSKAYFSVCNWLTAEADTDSMADKCWLSVQIVSTAVVAAAVVFGNCEFEAAVVESFVL